MKKIELSVLIPAFNDTRTIAEVVAAADRVAKKVASEYEIRVIDDASRDDTGNVLSDLKKKFPRLVVTSHKENAGYGGTIRELYFSGKYDWMFTVPGDNQIPPEELLKLIAFIGKADMIIGWRVNRNDPAARLRQSKIYNTLLKVLYGIRLHDINSVRLMKREIIQNITLSTVSAFVDAELAIDTIQKGYRVKETPINHRSREEEEGAGGGSLKTILPTITDMLKYRIGIV